MIGIALTLILLLGIPGTSGSSSDLGVLQGSLRRAELAFARTVRDKDFDAFLSFIDEDAVFVGETALRGREAIGQAWSIFFAPEAMPFVWEPATVEILGGGDLGLSTGPFWFEHQTKNERLVTMKGTFFSVWRKHTGGFWKIIFDSGTEPRPEAE